MTIVDSMKYKDLCRKGKVIVNEIAQRCLFKVTNMALNIELIKL